MPLKTLERIIIVAGPTCCGKTWFIKNLKSGKLKAIDVKLQIIDHNDWFYQDAYYLNSVKLKELEISSIKNVLLHWTIPLPRFKILLRNIALMGAYDKKPRIKFLHSAYNLNVLTLYANPTTLVQRVELRRKKILREWKKTHIYNLMKMYKMSNLNTVNMFYSDPKRYLPSYERWFRFVKNDLKPKVHYLIDTNSEPVLREEDNWYDILKKWNCPG